MMLTLEAPKPALLLALAPCLKPCMNSCGNRMFFDVHALSALLSFVLCVYLQVVWKMICRTPPYLQKTMKTHLSCFACFALLCFPCVSFCRIEKEWEKTLPSPRLWRAGHHLCMF